MKHFVIIFLSFWSLSVNAFNWSDLWSTPDQQGRDLMEKSQYKQAKEIFTRSDWAAAAAYRAGDYQRATELYQELADEQGYYNQGNTLAHMGQYEKAINAYNKALAMNPANQDALYNRKVIEDLLKKDKNKEQQDKEQQKKEQQDKEQQNKEQQNKEQQNKEQQNKEQQDKEQQNKEQQDKEQQNKEQQDKKQQDKEQQDKKQQDKKQQDKKQQDKKQQDKEQQDKEQQDKDKKNNNQKNSEAQSEAEREKQQAKEQWLRLIPDDPSGLMREKFLRDHLRRERGWYQ